MLWSKTLRIRPLRRLRHFLHFPHFLNHFQLHFLLPMSLFRCWNLLIQRKWRRRRRRKPQWCWRQQLLTRPFSGPPLLHDRFLRWAVEPSGFGARSAALQRGGNFRVFQHFLWFHSNNIHVQVAVKILKSNTKSISMSLQIASNIFFYFSDLNTCTCTSLKMRNSDNSCRSSSLMTVFDASMSAS